MMDIYKIWCQFCEDVNGRLYCMKGYGTDKCKGNKYNCIKQRCKDVAINTLSEREKVRRWNKRQKEI